ncbi:hypothetical protein ETH98_08585 [Macrococcoides caseolyticum]|uniref:hypothetical protein n=1 Tax=Macrococcoides caseolyticum TaxID=69966 RepID=UPI0010612C04|nr:hypothetical protein [Macrococcus caseolyticus]TDM28779.1 hypothetical protein ETH98_08585 [Macrococcus caseolyticus]VUC64615.1 Uncharacterised protein [Macrococcus caseolyticus]
MKKEFNTMTYGSLPLQLEIGKGVFVNKGVPVTALLDLETGEVTFKVSEKDLKTIKNEDE